LIPGRDRQEAVAGIRNQTSEAVYEVELILELRDLSKHYSGHRALDGVSLAVPRGAFYSLLGPSGCGKTTALRLIAGFEQPDRGEIFLEGALINGRPPYERNVNTVFQSYALFPHMTVRENVEFGLRRRRAADSSRRLRDVLDLVRLTGKEARYPSQISGGERQRVALARSLVLEPAVLLLDEPLSALDPNLRKEVRAELKSLQRRVGITFLFVTHDQEEALTLSDRIAVMDRGRIEQVGAPEEVYLAPRTRFVASFLGAVNWIEGVGVRPEATRVSRTAPGGVRSLAASVRSCLFLGSSIQVHAALPTGQALVAEVSRLDGGFEVGETVHVWWNPSDELKLPAEAR
jgi:ABC-type Fe3+/spermidine/putrescine transport system ATPase subunit